MSEADPAETGTPPETGGAGASVQIIPSVLGADQGRLSEAAVVSEEAGADRVQWDVMDGHFVPNLTFGPGVIAAAREVTDVPFEAHLMVTNPDRLLSEYVDAGCELLIVHAETAPHLHRTLARLREMGIGAGVALNPATSLSAVEHVVDLLDLLLVMTVNPGFAGQDYLTTMEPKIAAARRMLDEAGSDADLEVDGGIGPDTIARAARAGADTFCAGSAVFRADREPADAIGGLRKLAASAREAAADPETSDSAVKSGATAEGRVTPGPRQADREGGRG